MSTYADIGVLESFKQKARDWARRVVEVYNTPVPESLAAEKRSLLKSAKIIKQTIEGIFGTIDDLETVGMGIPLLIPVAVIAGAAAAIYKWNRDYQKFKEKLEYHKKLTESGKITARQASDLISNTFDNPLIKFNTKNVTALLAVGGLAYALYRMRR